MFNELIPNVTVNGVEHSKESRRIGSFFKGIDLVYRGAECRGNSVDDSACSLEYHGLDDDAVDWTESRANEALSGVLDGINAISKALIYTDKAEIKNEIDSIAWLLSGLADLGNDMLYASNQLSYLKHCRILANQGNQANK